MFFSNPVAVFVRIWLTEQLNSKVHVAVFGTTRRVTMMNYVANLPEYFLLFSIRFSFLVLHYVNVSVFIKFSQKTSVFTLIFISSP